MKAVFIGAGNLATRLSLELVRAGVSVVQVYSRTEASAARLAGRLECRWTTDLAEVVADADLYLFSVKDTALPELVARLKPNGALWVHTAGSMPMELFAGHAGRYGVLYPLQTFSREREVDFRRVPLFVEASSEADEALLLELAGRLSGNVRLLSSEKRKSLHLAAVFACNFTNHMYVLAERVLAEQGIPSDVLLPLIDETAAKVHAMTAAEAQTGPAVRYDENVINKHLAMLDDPELKELYRSISRSIHHTKRER